MSADNLVSNDLSDSTLCVFATPNSMRSVLLICTFCWMGKVCEFATDDNGCVNLVSVSNLGVEWETGHQFV
jgi:hypothetical protein